MSLTLQPAAYLDCYRLYEQAVTHTGMRVPFPTEADAKYFQLRMNQARVIQRAESRRIYPPEHVLHGKSEFDEFKVQVKQDVNDEWWVYVSPHGAWEALAQAEPIPNDEIAVLAPTHRPQQQLTYRTDPDANTSDDLV